MTDFGPPTYRPQTIFMDLQESIILKNTDTPLPQSASSNMYELSMFKGALKRVIFPAIFFEFLTHFQIANLIGQ